MQLKHQHRYLSSLVEKAKLIPIHKSGEMSERGNFRPISILVILSKILERHVFNLYFLYLTEHQILSDYQHGFRPGHSCETSLNMIYEYLVNNIDNGEINGVLMLDFSKAFDLVDHTILLQKIHAYGTTDLTLKWFASYLEGRTQQVQINEVLSEPLTIITGVPQSSILGPLLFLIFINDLPSFLTTSHPSLFADDSTLLAHGCELPDIKASLSTDLCITSNWARSNHKI
jgi:retron-type reverse transcriptase